MISADAAFLWERAERLLRGVWEDNRRELLYAAGLALYALVRAAGKTVTTGTTGLKFSFGRAKRELGPGFYPLIPFLQVVRVVPTRSRSINLPAQRVTTLDGLVYEVDANVVFRVVDVRRALIEIDDLERGMLQALGLGVQEVLRAQERGSLRVSASLDRMLAEVLGARLEPWGVGVERAGFTSIQPSQRTVRLTQLETRARRRAQVLASLERSTPRPQALALLGAAPRVVPRTRELRRRAFQRARERRLERLRQRISKEARQPPEPSGGTLHTFERAAKRARERQRERERTRVTGRT